MANFVGMTDFHFLLHFGVVASSAVKLIIFSHFMQHKQEKFQNALKTPLKLFGTRDMSEGWFIFLFLIQSEGQIFAVLQYFASFSIYHSCFCKFLQPFFKVNGNNR